MAVTPYCLRKEQLVLGGALLSGQGIKPRHCGSHGDLWQSHARPEHSGLYSGLMNRFWLNPVPSCQDLCELIDPPYWDGPILSVGIAAELEGTYLTLPEVQIDLYMTLVDSILQQGSEFFRNTFCSPHQKSHVKVSPSEVGHVRKVCVRRIEVGFNSNDNFRMLVPRK